MPDYSKAKIYRIVSNVCDLVYYGSTCETLSRRLAQHRCHYTKYLEGVGGDMTSFEIIEKGNYEIVLVENYPCNSREELHRRERFYIENNECVNKRVPCRTRKEYYEEICEKKKEYYEENREKILEKQKKYREDNREKILQKAKEKICCEICGNEITKNHIKHHQRSLKCLNSSIK